MAKSLVGLPLVIWQDILFSWLGELREVVRIDRACCFASFGNPLCAVYTGEAFTFAFDTSKNTHGGISGLCSWLQLRTVFISNLKLAQWNGDLAPKWQDLLAWCGESTKICSIIYSHKIPPIVLEWTSRSLRRVEKLSLNILIMGSPDSIRALLVNNAATLVSLNFNTNFNAPCQWTTLFARLRVLQWTYMESTNLFDFLRCCPSLTALSVIASEDAIEGIEQVIAVCCPLLRSLKLTELWGVSHDELLVIARGCPLLQYLELANCPDEMVEERFADVIQAMPNLHTLSVTWLPESALLEIAARGHPSLRVVDTSTAYTRVGLQQITAALPHLTGLVVRVIDFEADSNCVDLLANCQHLECLRIGTYKMQPATLEALLESVAAHCPNMRFLEVLCATKYTSRAIGDVMANCLKLRKLRPYNLVGVTKPSNRPGLTLTSAAIPRDEWLPGSAQWLD